MKWKTTKMQKRKKKKSLSQIMTYTHLFIILRILTVLGTVRPLQNKKKKEKNPVMSLPCSDSTVISA